MTGPKGGTVYQNWQKTNQTPTEPANPQENSVNPYRPPASQQKPDVPVSDLGSGSDYTVFLQHLGVPSTDISTNGPYGVYHSAFDNFNWFKKFADPDFTYEQQMARVLGIEVLRMADADILPFDYEEYGKEVVAYLDAAKKKSQAEFSGKDVDFSEAVHAAHRFLRAGAKVLTRQQYFSGDAVQLNRALRDAERALLIPDGLPHRSWYKHAIYAPGEYTGYAAVVIPGINEAIDKHDQERTRQQITALATALDRAAKVLESAR